MEKFLEDLNDLIKKWQKQYNKTEVESSQRVRIFRNMVNSKQSSEAQQVRGLVGKVLEYGDLANKSSHLVILHSLNLLAAHVEILRVTVDNLKAELT